MCRFMIYKGTDPILLENLLTKPAHSIINQSFDSRLRLDLRNPINGDGFGVGYYQYASDSSNSEDTAPEPQGNSPAADDAGDFESRLSVEENLKKLSPCIFRAITPAWNNINLNRLAASTRSKLVFAHVRASTYGVLSETNCHPFNYGNLMFMHNGGISQFSKIKKKLISHLNDEWFLYIQGSTDSECCFALFLDCLDKLGYDPRPNNFECELYQGNFPQTIPPVTHFPDHILRKALLQTILLIKNWQVAVTDEPSLLNFAVTDGESIVISRYITSLTDEAASLHFSTGSSFKASPDANDCNPPYEFKMERLNRSQDTIMIASEPLTFQREDWITVPTNTTLTVRRQTVLLHPIEDQFYDPDADRSSGLASSKGLMGNFPIGELSTNLASTQAGAANGTIASGSVNGHITSVTGVAGDDSDRLAASIPSFELIKGGGMAPPPLEREGRSRMNSQNHTVYGNLNKTHGPGEPLRKSPPCLTGSMCC
ncbi:hypothetical protein BABINDRAFT_162840 [Babjeviella inositovora NRRL Y-12698]|uniref:Glutamine amidotransferase type-2 domain-containing protein n=1 Tax=Babjeviella inositovora NRRL Y-12698 TaxID=984486 RepID=A0A1E3QKE6_9ASCO|nr:uncharacterized protein BABINDRAFT_162840 [Babjeviella inositovora NRRL Y-12698]ODQ78169.1 hypothetical protein BABINDRAFT_162840 [Babjeviella inositovora NRRL Y-12698]